MADIFREVDEDVRRERFEKLWKAYGKYILAAVALVVLAAVATVAWQGYIKSRREATGERFAQALTQARTGAAGDAATAFEQIAAGTRGGYRALAILQEAAAYIRAGEQAKAVSAYDRLAADGDVDKVLRDLGALLAALHSMDSGREDDVRRRLELLAREGSTWRYSARELLALLTLRGGDSARAKEQFLTLTDDLSAPPGIRARASELLRALGG
ncbi:MAG: tetratricopeptide repeat protein [Alphaproteobacteria bacterium]|nr:tetratricopeptide repeat protein [Alphaproteobacteria bacterium]